MTKKDLVESIKQNMPQGLTKLEIARYIYIELGKQKRFDIKYYYGNSGTRKKIKKLAMSARYNPKRFYDEKNIVCISMSYLYKSILKEFGIKCTVVTDDIGTTGHTMPVLTIDDEKRGHLKIRADLQRDMPWIQSGMQTDNFGRRDILNEEFTELFYEDLMEIDRKIGYITDDYKDKDIFELGQEIVGMNATKRLRCVLNDPRVTQKNNFQGFVEARQYYGNILDTLLKKYMRRKAFIFTCYRDKTDENTDDSVHREYTICAYSYENNQCNPYLYSIKENRFLPVSLGKLIELQDEGLVFGTSPKAQGTGLLKKILQNRRKEIAKQSQQEGR